MRPGRSLRPGNYGNEWTTTQHLKTSASLAQLAQIDSDKMIGMQSGRLARGVAERDLADTHVAWRVAYFLPPAAISDKESSWAGRAEPVQPHKGKAIQH
jgi:hypothetical protein